jgi:putative cardiolipin synthase
MDSTDYRSFVMNATRNGPIRRAFAAALMAIALFAGGCATLPPGFDGPKDVSTALEHPEATALGRQFDAQAKQHPGLSGFRLLIDGTNSFLLHEEIAAKAERTLDVQYFILRQDDTGKLVLQALLEAADRGVRVRLLLDDTEAFDAGSAIRPLTAHPNIEIRIWNPFVVRQELSLFRWAEFVIGGRRLNYRMHNKLFIGDNAIAVTGGRNIGDAYFQASTERELGDFDLAVVGPMVQALSRSFDRYWNDKLAIPVETLPLGKPTQADLDTCRKELDAHKEKMAASNYMFSLPKHDLLAEALAGKPPFVWAKAQLAYDTPDKAQVERDDQPGHLMWHRVAQAVEGTQRDLILVSPYLVPGDAEMALLRQLRGRGVRVRILTNSLASTDMPIVHVGYMGYRVPLLEAGCELYEVRPVLGKPQSGHGMIKSGSSSQFGLHAKVFVIDGQRAFVGSMNFDQRSLDINTEIGVIIDSPQIAREIVARFDAIVVPANSYRLELQPTSAGTKAVEWVTEVDGKRVTFDMDPDVGASKRTLIQVLSVLPIDAML